MKTKVINILGAPSVGKSTIASLVFAELKMLHYSAEIIHEYAKQLIYQGKFDELDNQYNVTFNQYHLVKCIENKVEYIVTDSPLILGCVYNKYHVGNVSNISKTEKMILEKNAEFENIYIYIERNPDFPYETAGRIHSSNESDTIGSLLKKVLQENNIVYKSFVSDRNSIPDILEWILKGCV